MFRILTQPIWRPFGTLRDNFHINFQINFHTNFTQFSHPGRGGHLKPFWAALGEASPAARHCALHGYLDSFCSPPGARLAKMREVPRIMRHPAHSHRLHSVCVAMCCRMVPLTWWRHPGPAPRCHMVSDSIGDARSFDSLGLPKHDPEVSGKAFLLSPF